MLYNKALQIVNWDRYEKSDSKKCVVMSWVAVPINHDGLGYIEMVTRPDGVRMIGGWLLILQVAARCPKRGLLVSDSGRILGAREISLKTRAPQDVIQETITTLLEVGWIEEVEVHPDGIRMASGLQDSTVQDKTGEGEDTSPTPPHQSSGERLKTTIRRLGLPSGKDAAREWADLCAGRAKCSDAEDGLAFIRFAVEQGKVKGLTIKYARDAAAMADEWASATPPAKAAQ